MKLRFVLGEAAEGLRRNLSMAVSVALVTMVSLLFLGIGLLGHQQVQAMKSYWYDQIEVAVVLCNETPGVAECPRGAVTEAERTGIESQLKAMGIVKSWRFESQQDAYARFQKQFADFPIAASTRPEHLKASYRVRLSDPAQYRQVASTFQGSPGVERVDDQRKVVDRLIDLVSTLSAATVTLAAIMLVCAVLLVATTVRQSAYGRRRETGIMRLVGASAWTIRAPFVLETMVSALVGALLALALLWLGLDWMGRQDSGLAMLDGVHAIGTSDVWRVAPVLVGTALVLAAVTSWVALLRHLRV